MARFKAVPDDGAIKTTDITLTLTLSNAKCQYTRLCVCVTKSTTELRPAICLVTCIITIHVANYVDILHDSSKIQYTP